MRVLVLDLVAAGIPPHGFWCDEDTFAAVASASGEHVVRRGGVDSPGVVGSIVAGHGAEVVWPNFYRFPERTGGGFLAAQLTELGVRFAGSDFPAVRGVSKRYSKECLDRDGVPTASWYSIDGAGRVATRTASPTRLSGPVVTKPEEGDESRGVEVLTRPPVVMGRYRSVVVEQFIPGREFTVGVVDTGTELMLAPLEIVLPANAAILSNRLKETALRQLARPVTEPHLAEQVVAVAGRAFRAVGARHYARVDIRVDPTGRPFVLEVNLLPGLRCCQDHPSLLPLAFEAVHGLEYGVLIELLLASVPQLEPSKRTRP